MQSKSRRRLLALVAIFSGLVFAITLVEVTLRVFDPIPTRVRGGRIVLPANITYEAPAVLYSDRKTIFHSKNSLGFRGPEPPSDWDDYATIIAVGGSTTECLLLNDSEDWPSVLHSQVKRRFPHVWVNNAGLDGHSTFGHQMLIQDILSKLRPNVIIFLIGVNDVCRET